MTVQSHPRTQLPALQLLPFFCSVFPTLNGMHRGGCLVGAGRMCVADPVLVHVLGITLQGEARVSCPRAGPHHVAAGACSADASPLSCVQPCRLSPSLCQCTSAPSDLQSGWEVAGLPPQASHTDFPAACLVLFQTTQMLLIKRVPKFNRYCC